MGQVFLQLGRGGLPNGAEEEIGLGLQCVNPLDSIECQHQSPGLGEIGLQVGNGDSSTLDQPLARLERERVDGPGAVLFPQAADDWCRSGDITQPQSRHGIALGHGVQQDDIVASHGIGRSQQAGQRVVLIGLIHDEQQVLIGQGQDLVDGQHMARRIVGVA